VRRVLLDENLPRKLRRELTECVVRTVQEEGWGSFKNGQLLGRAQTNFDVFLSADSNLKDQQNVARFDIGIVVILTVSLRLREILKAIEEIRAAVARVLPRELIEVEVPRPRRL
jgi:predicted nuclease of predicted toxin-antitoxin system